MAFYVHIHVCFACDENDGVARLAERHLPALRALAELAGREDSQAWPTERFRWYHAVGHAAHYLEVLAARRGPNPGWKGGLSLWGEVTNHASPLAFAEVLRPFWRDLLLASVRPPERGGFPGGPLRFTHVVVLYEEEGAEHAGALEIGLADEDAAVETGQGDVFVRHHPRLPFAWMQM